MNPLGQVYEDDDGNLYDVEAIQQFIAAEKIKPHALPITRDCLEHWKISDNVNPDVVAEKRARFEKHGVLEPLIAFAFEGDTEQRCHFYLRADEKVAGFVIVDGWHRLQAVLEVMPPEANGFTASVFCIPSQLHEHFLIDIRVH